MLYVPFVAISLFFLNIIRVYSCSLVVHVIVKILAIVIGCLLYIGFSNPCLELRGTEPGADTPNKLISVLFVGDTSFGENYQLAIEKKEGENILKTKGYDYSLKNFSSILRHADLVIANLETPLTSIPESPLAGKKKYLHAGDVVRTPATLRKHNISTVSLANNHTMDFGIEGVEQSLEALEKSDMHVFGAGLSESEASRSFRKNFELYDKTIRLVVVAGFEYTKHYDETYAFYANGNTGGVNAWTTEIAVKQVEAIRKADHNAFIVAFPHWGRNYAWKTEEQTKLAHALIDADADLIIGHGAHMLQEIEQYKDRWIIYGLGNFVFNSPGRYRKMKAAPFSLAARLDMVEQKREITFTLKLYPILSDNMITNYQPRFVTEREFKRVHNLLIKHSPDPENLQNRLISGTDEYGLYFSLDVDSD